MTAGQATSETEITLYLPPEVGRRLQMRINGGRWQDLSPDAEGLCRISPHTPKPGTAFEFRYIDGQGRKRPIMPLAGLENLRGCFYFEPEDYAWQHDPPQPGHARVCLECTLEGLLGGYSMGRYAASDIQDLLIRSLAERICDSRLPELLEQMQVDEVMAPMFPSVADRVKLDPKFNYLVYDIGAVDWQIGRPAEVKQMIDRFFAHGIALVPDMIFAHAVREPYPGSMDAVNSPDENRGVLRDDDAWLFRDYGTWMFNWENEQVRAILIEKLVRFIEAYRFPVVRVDYIDGMIYQYRDRPTNAAETAMLELAARLEALQDRPLVIGEAFSTAEHAAVKRLIQAFYRPRGFAIAEQLYRPPSKNARPDKPDIEPILTTLHGLEQIDHAEAVYAQLHDEAWEDEHIRAGRPDTPWAYGALPAQLALNVGRELASQNLFGERDLLDFTRRRVRAVEAMTMFISTTRYMMLPAVDALTLGRLDEAGRWRMNWDDPVARDMRVWLKTGLHEADIFRLHDQHRADMVQLRRLYRQHTPVDEETQQPWIRVKLIQGDPASAVICLGRYHIEGRIEPVLVIFNLGLTSFPPSLPYQVLLPPDWAGAWRVLFDGDRFDTNHLRPGELPAGYEAGHIVQTQWSELYESPNVLPLTLGGNSLLILERC